MATYAVDTAGVRSAGASARGDAEQGEVLRALAQTIRGMSAAAGSARVADAGWSLAARMGEHVEQTSRAARILAVALEASARAYQDVEDAIDAFFVPRWIP